MTTEQETGSKPEEVEATASGVKDDNEESSPEAPADEKGESPSGAETSNGDGGDEKEKSDENYVSVDAPWSERMWEVFTTFWPLGLVAFGGPQAHVAILRDHLVVQRNWLDEEQFTELFAIGQGLPGPTSTQLVISTALSRAGPLGGLSEFILNIRNRSPSMM